MAFMGRLSTTYVVTDYLFHALYLVCGYDTLPFPADISVRR